MLAFCCTNNQFISGDSWVLVLSSGLRHCCVDAHYPRCGRWEPLQAGSSDKAQIVFRLQVSQPQFWSQPSVLRSSASSWWGMAFGSQDLGAQGTLTFPRPPRDSVLGLRTDLQPPCSVGDLCWARARPAQHLPVSALPAESRACNPQGFALASTPCPLTSLLEQMRKQMRTNDSGEFGTCVYWQ